MRRSHGPAGQSTPGGGRSRWRLAIVAAALLTHGAWAPGVLAGADARPPALVGATALHEAGVEGRGVTVAVVGGRRLLAPEVRLTASGRDRLLAFYDAVVEAAGPAAAAGEGGASGGDLEAMLSSRRDAVGRFHGVAPEADLVLVRALGPEGTGRLADVARGVDWVVANRERYGIRVLVLPLVLPARPGAGDGRLARPVLAAWEAGIVVVVAAGDGGPEPATVAAPGDLPRILTVGAAADGPVPAVAGYSASGPTLDGFVKPEVVAPSPRGDVAPPLLGVAGRGARLAEGTSAAAALVGGVAALLLEARPWLTPDELKLWLLATARPMAGADGSPLPVWRQGAGLVDAGAALRGITWSDEKLRGVPWAGEELRGITWSDEALRGMTWSD